MSLLSLSLAFPLPLLAAASASMARFPASPSALGSAFRASGADALERTSETSRSVRVMSSPSPFSVVLRPSWPRAHTGQRFLWQRHGGRPAEESGAEAVARINDAHDRQENRMRWKQMRFVFGRR